MAADFKRSLGAINAASAYFSAGGKEKGLRPVLTISRDYGSGGGDIARLLAERLNVECYDKEILDAITERAGADRQLLERLDDKVGEELGVWLYSLVTGQRATRADYVNFLFKVILGIGAQGGVILGRGGHLILADKKKVLRVRITGSPDRCAERVAEKEGMTLKAAKDRLLEVRQERGRFIWEVFHKRLNDPSTFDLVINTDRFNSIEPLMAIILESLEGIGGIAAAHRLEGLYTRKN